MTVLGLNNVPKHRAPPPPSAAVTAYTKNILSTLLKRPLSIVDALSDATAYIPRVTCYIVGVSVKPNSITLSDSN